MVIANSTIHSYHRHLQKQGAINIRGEPEQALNTRETGSGFTCMFVGSLDRIQALICGGGRESLVSTVNGCVHFPGISGNSIISINDDVWSTVCIAVYTVTGADSALFRGPFPDCSDKAVQLTFVLHCLPELQ